MSFLRLWKGIKLLRGLTCLPLSGKDVQMPILAIECLSITPCSSLIQVKKLLHHGEYRGRHFANDKSLPETPGMPVLHVTICNELVQDVRKVNCKAVDTINRIKTFLDINRA